LKKGEEKIRTVREGGENSLEELVLRKRGWKNRENTTRRSLQGKGDSKKRRLKNIEKTGRLAKPRPKTQKRTPERSPWIKAKKGEKTAPDAPWKNRNSVKKRNSPYPLTRNFK